LQGVLDRAVADFTRAISLEPNNAVYCHNRGYCYRNMGEYAKAVADYSKAIDVNPWNCAAFNNRYLTRGILSIYHLLQPPQDLKKSCPGLIKLGYSTVRYSRTGSL
jgi:tetratricopeptide (TPR) repeat protein